MTNDELKQLWSDYKTSPTIELRNQLIIQYTNFVHHVASKVYQKSFEPVDYDDMFIAGIFGLIDAIESYDPTRNIKFESFGYYRIRGAIIDELRKIDCASRQMRTCRTKLEQAKANLQEKLYREPTHSELVYHLGLTNAEYDSFAMKANIAGRLSIDQPIYKYNTSRPTTFAETIEDEQGSQDMGDFVNRDQIEFLLNKLNDKERWIAELYYLQNKTMKQIGEIAELSESRVSQLMQYTILPQLKEAARYYFEDEMSSEMNNEVSISDINDSAIQCPRCTIHGKGHLKFSSLCKPIYLKDEDGDLIVDDDNPSGIILFTHFAICPVAQEPVLWNENDHCSMMVQAA